MHSRRVTLLSALHLRNILLPPKDGAVANCGDHHSRDQRHSLPFAAQRALLQLGIAHREQSGDELQKRLVRTITVLAMIRCYRLGALRP